MYYGAVEDMPVKQTVACNNSLYHAQRAISQWVDDSWWESLLNKLHWLQPFWCDWQDSTYYMDVATHSVEPRGLWNGGAMGIQIHTNASVSSWLSHVIHVYTQLYVPHSYSVYCSDFYIWTFIYDISGLSSVTFNYRTDADGQNPIGSTANEVYKSGQLNITVYAIFT